MARASDREAPRGRLSLATRMEFFRFQRCQWQRQELERLKAHTGGRSRRPGRWQVGSEGPPGPWEG